MKLPAFTYGTYANVGAACRKKIRDISRGARWEDLPEDKWVDTKEVGGALVLEGPVSGFSGDMHYCCFALTVAVSEAWRKKRMGNDVWTSLHEASMRNMWIFLGLLGQHSGMFLYQNRAWMQPFLKAAVEFWEELDAEGDRYTFGGPPSRLWTLPSNIQMVLAHLGLPENRLREPLPPGGLQELATDVLKRLPES